MKRGKDYKRDLEKEISQNDFTKDCKRVLLESTNLDEYELHTSIRASEWLPSWIREVRRGWHPVKGVQRYCIRELTVARDLLYLPPVNIDVRLVSN